MNSDTGQIYRGDREISDALRRGEPLEPIGRRVAEIDKQAGASGVDAPKPGDVDKDGKPYFHPQTGRKLSRRERRGRMTHQTKLHPNTPILAGFKSGLM